jgi:hypothetical protein
MEEWKILDSISNTLFDLLLEKTRMSEDRADAMAKVMIAAGQRWWEEGR